MRGAFAKTLVELAQKDPRVFLLTGDLGFMALEPFANSFPDRFVNVGVAEQNMLGVATGLAEAGYLPFVYSIVTFASLRPYEFIRNGPILHNLPVRIVGVGGGMEYGHNGASHYGLEDIGVMRVQPGITVIAPADYNQTAAALNATWDLSGPIYYRLGKDDRKIVQGLDGRFNLESVEKLSSGNDILIVSMGGIAYEAAQAVAQLAEHGIAATHVVVSTLNPAPKRDLITYLSKFKNVITVEAHYAVGGIGSLVSEIVAENGINTRVTKCAVFNSPDGVSGNQPYLYEKCGISPGAIAEKARMLLSGVPA